MTNEEKMLANIFQDEMPEKSSPDMIYQPDVAKQISLLLMQKKPTKRMYKVGSIRLKDTCDITDPCYSSDVWCRHTVENMMPGNYNCYAEISDEGEWGIRVASSVIIHESYDVHFGQVPEELMPLKKYTCGVDAGLFGYFDNKPDFSDLEWEEFCNNLDDYPSAQVDKYDGRDGFVTSSGYGDGGCEATAWADSGIIVAISTEFI